MQQLQGRNALLTGAAGGLGHYIARALAAEGVNLALCDLPSASVDDLVEELRPLGVRVESVPADLSDTAGLEMLAGHAAEAIGPLDILVNNAGVEFARPYAEQTREELETTTTVNVLAVMELTRVVLPGMLERGRGHIVNLASLAGKVPTPFLTSYSASKHAVVGFTHSLRAEIGPEPVGLTAICPGFISQVGMYGRLEPLVGSPPRELGTLPPHRVGEAVVVGIRENRPEVIVNEKRVKHVIALAAAAPPLFLRAIRRERNLAFGRRFADARRKLEGES